MRIRKNAKISPLVYAVSTLKAGIFLQPHVCQLNQSPWDAMSFSPPPSPPPSQVNGSGASPENGSSGGFIPAPQSEPNVHRESEYPDDTMQEDDHPAPPPPEKVVMCCKTDGKSWQCRREASKGHSLCDHHLLLVKSYSANSSSHLTKKAAAGEAPPPQLPPSRRTRPKKVPTSSGPNEYYYYSGFGPRWGKDRGERSRNNEQKEIGVNHEIEVSDHSVEYEEDDEDMEEEEKKVGKKRVRKPIKARSLKSLM